MCPRKVQSSDDVVLWLRCRFKHKTNRVMPRGRNWSKTDLNAPRNRESFECRNIFPEETPRSLLTKADDSMACKLIFSSFLTTSNSGLSLNLKPLWEAWRGLGAKEMLPGEKVIQWYSDLHFLKSFFLLF